MSTTFSPSRVPFELPAGVGTPQQIKDGTRCGRGIVRSVVVSSTGADVAIAHDLGRIPVMWLVLDSGSTYTPKTKRGSTAWTRTNAYLQFDTTGTFLVWVN